MLIICFYLGGVITDCNPPTRDIANDQIGVICVCVCVGEYCGHVSNLVRDPLPVSLLVFAPDLAALKYHSLHVRDLAVEISH